MLASPESLALVDECERCHKRYIPPPEARLGVAGSFRAVRMGLGRSVRLHKSLETGRAEARQQILTAAQDAAYRAFVQGFELCRSCRQFVCEDCWHGPGRACRSCSLGARIAAAPPPLVETVSAPLVSAPPVAAPLVSAMLAAFQPASVPPASVPPASATPPATLPREAAIVLLPDVSLRRPPSRGRGRRTPGHGRGLRRNGGVAR